jgi:peroxiredoxin
MPTLTSPPRVGPLPRRPLRVIQAAVLAATWLPACLAGTYNPDRSIGNVIPAWEGLAGTDGKTHSWQDVADRDAVVVVFTCNSCPYAVDYEQRINDLAARFAGKQSRVAVVAINANLIPEDALPAMKTRAAARNFQFPYLFDESQAVARSFGAVRTPEFFVLDKQRRIVYMGAMDDNTTAAEAKHRYVDDALTAVLEGKPVTVKETPPVGCLIRFDRRRSRR